MTEATFGGHSMIADLQRVLVQQPTLALANACAKQWHYTEAVCYQSACAEHQRFVNMLENTGIEVIHQHNAAAHLADAIFVHDPALITNAGAIILRMGKALRHGEEDILRQTLEAQSIPILGVLSRDALAECGDMAWLDSETLLCGRGFRTNQNGIDEIRALLAQQNIKVLTFDLPYFQGELACLHLQSIISFVDHQKALVYLPLLPTNLYQLLLEKNYQLIEVPESEFLTLGTNVLAIKPGEVIAIDVNHHTREMLQQAGVTVHAFAGNDLCLKTEGGPTCLTRPLKRKL